MMLRFVLTRLGLLVLALLVSSFAIFGSLYLAPGNALATLSGGRTLPPEAVAALERQYHLDDPFLTRYWHWLSGAVRGDLGESIATRQHVASVIGEHAGVTAGLVLYAAVIILVVGIGSGIVAGLRRGPVDGIVLVATAAFAAVPAFLAAIVLIAVFAVGLGWFPALGPGDGIGDRIVHLTLPAVALAMSGFAVVARITRVSVRQELVREHVQTAVSRGIPYRTVVRRHVLRNAAIPIATVSGITLASLIATSAVVETAFSLNGLGQTLVQSASSKDFAVVQGIALVLVVAFIVANALVDAIHALLDPRVKLGGRAA
ncbi:ABC transporter permease [Patulibacter sp. S7RM1-6]